MDIILEKLYKVVTDFESFRNIDTEDVLEYKVNTQYQEGTFESYEELTKWSDYKTGDFWGTKGDYCWFTTDVVIPERFHNKKVMFSISTGHKEGWDISNPQFLIYVNGSLRQGLDVNHKNTMLSQCAKKNTSYNIVMLGYSGIEEESVILKSAMKVIEPLIEDFYYNISNLFWTLSLMDKEDSKRPKFIRNMLESVDLLDLRHIYSENFYNSVTKANEFLIEKYYTVVNQDCPTVTTIGHTHIDIAWLWTIEQTKEKVIRSFSTVLELMDKFPDYRFMSSQPQLYEYVKEYNPELFEKIKTKVKEGRWEIDGGMWLEADCNIPSGESLARQFLYASRFMKKEFNKKSSTLWLPDVFGYSAALPQLIKKSGMSYMMTSKLDWNNYNKLPHDTFYWRGIDGSEVLTHLITTTNDVSYHEDIYQRKNVTPQTTYNGRLNPNQVKGTWTRYQDKLLSDETLQLFGFGDGGGGPTEEMLENYKRLKYGLPGIPKVDMDFQKNFFDRLQQKAKQSKHIKKWQGELYLEFHQGTYTSMAKNKRSNRKAEFMYQTIEGLSTLANLYNPTYKYPSEELYKNWKHILLYQFHDIIPGTSILDVYKETDKGYEEIHSNGQRLLNEAMEALAIGLKLPMNSCIVFNPLSHNRSDIVTLTADEDKTMTSVIDAMGNEYPIYKSRDKQKYTFLATDVPPKGIKLFTINSIPNSDIKSQTINDLQYQKISELENVYYHIQFNEHMEIKSLYDKENKREMIKADGRGNILQVFEDRPRRFDNWNIDASYKDKCYEINHVESSLILESNPLYKVLEIKRQYGASTIVQKLYLYNYQARIDFHSEIDWHEQHALLKASFEVDLNAIEATYDIQYGNLKRPTHENTSWEEAQYEVCAHKWADISESGYGISLMNDCKYGYDIKDDCMGITLIKCGTYPNEEADQGYHEFTYSIYGHSQTWRESETVELAYSLNVPLESYRVNKSSVSIENKLNKFSFINCLQKNIIIDTIKMSEDEDGTIIRLFETKNTRNNFEFKSLFKIKSLYLCDLVENKVEKLHHEEYRFDLTIKGYEVVTLHLEFEKEVNYEN